MTTLELLKYYSNLLILQYQGKPKAVATIEAWTAPVLIPQTSVQTLDFSAVPTSGSFVLSYQGNATSSLSFSISPAALQAALRLLPGLASVSVTGSLASQEITVTFTGVIPPALSLGTVSNTLQASGSRVTLTLTETDLTLPLAVQSAFNLIGPHPARGVQLDVLGKYAGVTRTGYGFNGQPITVNDSDFLTLIQMAIITNNAGSSLSEIDSLLFNFFQGNVLVFDHSNMSMTYLLSSSIGSTQLIQLFVTENLLPAPMGVALSIIYAPVINAFFGFVTYPMPTQPPITRPFNSYTNYHMNWPWLSYQLVVT